MVKHRLYSPRLDEEPIEAANRRLYFEMGLNCELKHCFNFIYKADLENGLIEHEYDHVFIGIATYIQTLTKMKFQSLNI